MCLILFALNRHRDYPLIVAANRDEFFQRPTLSAQFWQEAPQLLAGRDQQAGGTWLGVNHHGQFSAVTNVRNGRETQDRPASRGELVTRCLVNNGKTQATLSHIASQKENYNGFNLLAGGPNELWYYSNRTQSAPEILASGVYGLSNAQLDTPWPKVASAKSELHALLDKDWQALDERQADLLALLANNQQAPADQLPDTGIAPEFEALLSSRFIASPDYGTRASTVVLFHRSGKIHFTEQAFDHQTSLGVREFVIGG